VNILDVSLVDEPLDVSEFSYLTDNDYPCALLGVQIKNLYDQKRLQFNSKFKPINTIHCVPNERIMPKFFRGLEIKLNTNLNTLIEKLDTLDFSSKNIILNYKNILSEFNLTANNCFAFLQKGTYPIDSECLDYCTSNNEPIEHIYENIFLNTDIPSFQNYGYLVIYILSNKNFKKTNIKNFIFSAVKSYDN
jgi:hypothetical protein